MTRLRDIVVHFPHKFQQGGQQSAADLPSSSEQVVLIQLHRHYKIARLVRFIVVKVEIFVEYLK